MYTGVMLFYHVYCVTYMNKVELESYFAAIQKESDFDELEVVGEVINPAGDKTIYVHCPEAKKFYFDGDFYNKMDEAKKDLLTLGLAGIK